MPFDDSKGDCPRCAEFCEAQRNHTKLPESNRTAFIMHYFLDQFKWAKDWSEPAQVAFGLDYKPYIYTDPVEQSPTVEEGNQG